MSTKMILDKDLGLIKKIQNIFNEDLKNILDKDILKILRKKF
jgi:hypothetical protein